MGGDRAALTSRSDALRGPGALAGVANRDGASTKEAQDRETSDPHGLWRLSSEH
jgi:hypothetical protein